jgi:hypothetical protein
MNTKLHHLERRFERHVAHAAEDLPKLEREIDHIGGVAHAALHNRLHHVEVMEQALRRNCGEILHASARPEARRVRKLRRLARCIERETDNLHHEVDFLAMGSGSTLVAFVEGSNNLLDRWAKRLSHVISHRQRTDVDSGW